MTRWHEDDLAGRFLVAEENEWDIINIPAIKREYNEYDPREIGEALFPEKHDITKLLRLEALDQGTFESLYQQNPVSKEGNKIKKESISIVDNLPNGYLKSDFYIYFNKGISYHSDLLELACHKDIVKNLGL
jgi:hypothetical protein